MQFGYSKMFLVFLISLSMILSAGAQGDFEFDNGTNLVSGEETALTGVSVDQIEADSNHGSITVYKIPQDIDILDGEVGLWEFVPSQQFELSSTSTSATLDLTFSVVHNGSMLFFAFDYYDATRADENPANTADNVDVILDIDEDDVWDQFNPGAEMMDYIKGLWGLGSGEPFPVVYDRYNYDITFERDINNGGTDDAVGGGSYDQSTSRYFFEMGQQFNSGDSLDINLEIGDQIMYLLNVIVDGESFSSGFPTLGYNFTISPEEINLSPPNVEYLAPTSSTYLDTNNVDISFSVDKTTDWMGYSLDGNVNQTITGNFSLFSLSEGDHELVIYANDTYGRMGQSALLTFTIDTISPEITIESPQPSMSYTQSQVWLNFTVNEEVSWLKYAINEGANTSISDTAILLDLATGNYTIQVFAGDLAGNEVKQSVAVSVQISSSTDTTDSSTSSTSSSSSSSSGSTSSSDTTSPSSTSTQTSTTDQTGSTNSTNSIENPLPFAFVNIAWVLVSTLILFDYSRRRK